MRGNQIDGRFICRLPHGERVQRTVAGSGHAHLFSYDRLTAFGCKVAQGDGLTVGRKQDVTRRTTDGAPALRRDSGLPERSVTLTITQDGHVGASWNQGNTLCEQRTVERLRQMAFARVDLHPNQWECSPVGEHAEHQAHTAPSDRAAINDDHQRDTRQHREQCLSNRHHPALHRHLVVLEATPKAHHHALVTARPPGVCSTILGDWACCAPTIPQINNVKVCRCRRSWPETRPYSCSIQRSMAR